MGQIVSANLVELVTKIYESEQRISNMQETLEQFDYKIGTYVLSAG